MKIEVAWSRRAKLNGPKTTDEEGYYPYVFSFTDGRRITVDVHGETCPAASCWQEKLFESPCFLTKVEIWTARNGDVYIYAEPDTEMKEKLKCK